MKFLCDNCKAKYQIPDEKIQGRTLRMKCRKCEHDIIIRGDGGEARPPKTVAPSSALSVPASMGPSSASVAAPRSRTSGTGVPPRAATASALGADFQKRVAAGAADAPAERPEVAKLWHVAINDVPVGPIRREDLAKKVGTGEVTGESLCWREGFDDWRPVREVTELASLLDQRRPPVIRASGEIAPEPSRPSIDPIGGRHGAAAAAPHEESDDDDATVVGTSLMREMEEQQEREREQKQRAAAAAASPARAKPQEREASVKVAVAAITPPAASAAPESVKPVVVAAAPRATATDSLIPPARKKRPMSPGVLMAIASALGFGMMMAFLLVDRVFAPETPPQVAQPAPVAPTQPDQPIARTDLETDVEGEVADPSAPEAPVTPTTAPTHPTAAHPTSGQPRTPTTATTAATATPPPAQNLTAEQRAMMERMGASDTERLPATNIAVPTTSQSAGAAHGPLSASDLGAVVNRNKIQLQRCHERALRGMSSAPAVRMDVSLRVSAAGSVTTATAAGSDFGGLKSCIEQTVRRWRFPESSGGGETRFPVVFQAVN